MIHHFSGWMNKKKQKRHTFMYLYLLSMCIYAWVWIVACTPRHMLFFSFLFSIVCVCVCVCVCVHITYSVCVLACAWWGERRGNGRRRTHYIKWGVQCARFWDSTGPCVWENKQKEGGGFASKHMSRCEAVWPWLSWLLFQLSLTFKAVLKAAVHSCILFITMASKWITFPLSVLQMRRKDSRLLSE